MGFFSGRVTFARYRVKGASPGMFGPEHLERLQAHAIGKQRVGSTAVSVVDRLLLLFEQTFGCGFEPLGAGRQMFRLAELRQQTRGIDDAGPAPFVPGVSPSEVAWLPDETNRDFLGNEYLLWLWFMLDADSDTIRLSDDS